MGEKPAAAGGMGVPHFSFFSTLFLYKVRLPKRRFSGPWMGVWASPILIVLGLLIHDLCRDPALSFTRAQRALWGRLGFFVLGSTKVV